MLRVVLDERSIDLQLRRGQALYLREHRVPRAVVIDRQAYSAEPKSGEAMGNTGAFQHRQALGDFDPKRSPGQSSIEIAIETVIEVDGAELRGRHVDGDFDVDALRAPVDEGLEGLIDHEPSERM